MHYQIPPFEEVKMVSCIRGSIYDIVIDLRRDSPTYCEWIAVELSEKNFKMVYIPKCCAHGFQTLEDNTIVYYQMNEFFHPECARGVRWDDPKFKITLPLQNLIISQKDNSFELFCS